MEGNAGFDGHMSADSDSPRKLIEAARFGGHWEVVCRDKDGNEKWRDTIKNIVVNAGLNYLLDAGISAATQITSWFLLLLSASPTVAAADTMSSHSGWTEITAYDESTRQAYVDAGVSSQQLTNAASPAVFTISANGTNIGGAGLTSSSTKGGTTGTLYAAGAFTAGNKDLDDNDTLTVTAQFSATG